MRISTKADYGVRTALALARSPAQTSTPEQLAAQVQVAPPFVDSLLTELARAGLVERQKGLSATVSLVRAPAEITLAEILRALEGPLASVRGKRPEDVEYPDDAAPLRDVWIALRAAVRSVLEATTLAHLVDDELLPQLRRAGGAVA